MDRQVVVYEVLDKSDTVVLTGELYVYGDGQWLMPEAIRDLPAGDYVFRIGELNIETMIIDPASLARDREEKLFLETVRRTGFSPNS